jgi:hypothetical protein
LGVVILIVLIAGVLALKTLVIRIWARQTRKLPG